MQLTWVSQIPLFYTRQVMCTAAWDFPSPAILTSHYDSFKTIRQSLHYNLRRYVQSLLKVSQIPAGRYQKV